MIPPVAYIAAGTLALGVLGGWTVRDWKADADALAAMKKAEKVQVQMQKRIDDQATEYEAFRASIEPARIESRNTIREIFRNVPVSVDCAAPDPLRGLLAGQVARANAAASGESGITMSENPGPAEPAGRPPTR